MLISLFCKNYYCQVYFATCNSNALFIVAEDNVFMKVNCTGVIQQVQVMSRSLLHDCELYIPESLTNL